MLTMSFQFETSGSVSSLEGLRVRTRNQFQSPVLYSEVCELYISVVCRKDDY